MGPVCVLCVCVCVCMVMTIGQGSGHHLSGVVQWSVVSLSLPCLVLCNGVVKVVGIFHLCLGSGMKFVSRQGVKVKMMCAGV